MNNRFRNPLALFGMAVVATLVGCGSASNNDQGASVTLVDFTPTTPLILRLGEIQPEPGGAAGDPVLESSSYYATVTVQNNIVSQGFRAQRLFLDFYIPGAQSQPPSTSVPFSVVLGAGSGTDEIQSTLPESFRGLANSKSVQIPVIPASVRQWISFNRASIPEPPFQMEIRGTVSGITTAGDRLDTNQEFTYAEVIIETDVVPTEGTGSDASTTLPADESTSDIATDGSDTSTDTSGDDGLEGLADSIPAGGTDSTL